MSNYTIDIMVNRYTNESVHDFLDVDKILEQQYSNFSPCIPWVTSVIIDIDDT